MKNKYLLLTFFMVNPALAQEPDIPMDLYCTNFDIGLQTYDKQQDLHILHYKNWMVTLDDPSSGCGNSGCIGTVINLDTKKSFSKYFDCFPKKDAGAICKLNRNYWNFVRSEDKNIYHSPQCNGENIVIDKEKCNECECPFIYSNGQSSFSARCKDFDENNMTCYTYTGYEDRYIGQYPDIAERYENCNL